MKWNRLLQQLVLMARTIVEHAAGLQGLFGLDFRLDGDQIWVTEINPRYTASVEILELASGCSFFNPAVRPQPGFPRVPAASTIAAKRILYASRKQDVPDLSHLFSNGNPWQVPEFADIPVDGTTIDSGWPICSVLASGANEDEVNSRLVEQILRVKTLLANHCLHG